MKTAGENVSILKSRNALKWMLDEYENFDAAKRLCADYCVTSNDIALMIDEIPEPERLKSRLAFVGQSDESIDLGEAYLVAQ
jgi:hypothetical protein